MKRQALVLLLTLSFVQFVVCSEDRETNKESATEEAAKYRLLGDEAFKAKKYDTSLEHYSKAVEVEPSNFLNAYKRSGVYLMRGRNKKALRDLDKVLKLEPQHIQSLVRRGKLLMQMGDFDKAEEDIKAAIALKPSNTIAQTTNAKIVAARKLRATAEAQTENKNWKAAHASWKKVTETLDLCEDCLLAMARCSDELNDHDAVIEETIKLLKLNGRNLQGLILRGKALTAIGDADTAMKFYRQGLKSDPDNKNLKQPFLKLKKFIKAHDAARDAYANKRWEEALEKYGEAAEILPDWHEVHIFFEKKCHSLVELKRADEAVLECNRALGIRDDLFEAHLYRAEAYILKDDIDNAVRDFQRARTINQHDRRAQEGAQRAERLQKMKSRKDYYKILDIPKTSTHKEIKKAFRRKALEWHPDKHNGEAKIKAEKMIQDINEAYDVLTDEEKKGRYDRGEDLDSHNNFQHNPFQGGSPFHFTWKFN